MSSWPFGAYPAGGIEPLGPHVDAYYADDAPFANSAIVRGTEATLVFDANVVRYARALREAVDARSGPPLRHLVLSHVHADHAHGAMHFVPPAVAWARAFTRERLAYWAGRDLEPHAQEYAAYDPAFEDEERAARIVVPEHVVEADLTIDLGGVTVRLRPEGTAHTPGDLWALVEPDRVALCGDLWFNDVEPYFGHGSLAGSISALASLRAAGAGIYLPGHGRAGPLPDAAADPMERLAAWLDEAVREGVRAGLRGPELRAAIRGAFDGQAATHAGIRFAVRFPGFLEEGIEKAEADLIAGLDSNTAGRGG